MTRTTLIGELLLGALYISIAVAILVTAMLAVPPNAPKHSSVLIDGEVVLVTVADTKDTLAKGLSGNKGLLPNEGMLFIFPKPEFSGFWMKDMLFPIDIIWFDENSKIVDVWENAMPESYPQIHTPRSPSQFVLEVTAGFFLKHNLKIGDSFKILQ